MDEIDRELATKIRSLSVLLTGNEATRISLNGLEEEGIQFKHDSRQTLKDNLLRVSLLEEGQDVTPEGYEFASRQNDTVDFWKESKNYFNIQREIFVNNFADHEYRGSEFHSDRKQMKYKERYALKISPSGFQFTLAKINRRVEVRQGRERTAIEGPIGFISAEADPKIPLEPHKQKELDYFIPRLEDIVDVALTVLEHGKKQGQNR